MKVGDRVTWESQSGSFKTTKTGMIVAVVPPKMGPSRFIPEGYACNSKDGFGICRDHETYLVKVDGKGRKLYWPRVQWLKAVTESGIAMRGMGLLGQIADLERQRDGLAKAYAELKADFDRLSKEAKEFEAIWRSERNNREADRDHAADMSIMGKDTCG